MAILAKECELLEKAAKYGLTPPTDEQAAQGATTPPCHHATAPPRHHATTPPRHRVTAPPRHHATTLPRHHANAPTRHRINPPPPHTNPTPPPASATITVMTTLITPTTPTNPQLGGALCYLFYIAVTQEDIRRCEGGSALVTAAQRGDVPKVGKLLWAMVDIEARDVRAP